MTPPGIFRGLRTVKYSVADLAGAKAWYTEVLGVIENPHFTATPRGAGQARG